MEIKGLIFDMDGTMFATEAISVRAMQYASKKHHIRLTMDTIYGFMGLPRPEIQKQFYELFGSDFDFDAYLTDKIEFQNRKIEENGVPVKPGLPELLQYAQKQHIACGVATSTSRLRAEDLIVRSGLAEYFSAVTCGDEVEHGKPAPDIFLQTAKKLEIMPTQCMGIEDSRNGILALSRSGMLAVLVPDLIPPDAQMQSAADLEFQNLFGVLDYLQSI